MAGYRDYLSPRGVHVDTHFDPPLDDEDESPVYYAPSPRRNRYSRSNQTPRIRDVNWMPAPQHSVPSPAPWTPAPILAPDPVEILRSPSLRQASPALTEHEIGEHMVIDGVEYGDYEEVAGLEPPRKSSGNRFVGVFIKGLKKFPRFHLRRASGTSSSYDAAQVPDVNDQRPVSNESLEYLDMPAPQPAPAPPSPHVRPASGGAMLGGGAASVHGVSPHRSPVVLAPMMMAPPSSASASSSERSSSPSPLGQVPHFNIPGMGGRSHEGPSHTFQEPIRPITPITVTGEPQPQPILIPPQPQPQVQPQPPTTAHHVQFQSPIDQPPSTNSIAFQAARFQRFIKGISDLPWVSESQIADEYIPGQNTRSRIRDQMRKGSEPSWYNPRPVYAPPPMQWQQEWDPWAQQSAAVLVNAIHTGDEMAGAGGQGGVRYPHGYTPQPVFLYPSGFPPPGVFRDPVP